MMISSRAHLSRTYVLTTALAERIVDAIVLVVISTTAISVMPSQFGRLECGIAHVVGIAGLAAIVILPYMQGVRPNSIGASPLPPRIHDKVQTLS